MSALIIKCTFLEDGKLIEEERELPEGVTKIDNRTITQIIQGRDNPSKRVYKKYFGWCDVPIRSKLIKIVLPEGITEIEKFTFVRYDYLKEVVIPNSVIKIANYAFLECIALRKVIILARVKIPQQLNIVEISQYAFFGCPKYNIIFSKDI